MKLRTPDGWTVEVVTYDAGDQWLRLTDRHGFLTGSTSDRIGGAHFKNQGHFRTPAEVEKIMGSDAFAQLVPA